MRWRGLVWALVAVVALGATWASAPGRAGARPRAAHRAWIVTIPGPAQFDFVLAEVRFVAPSRIALKGSPGLDYVAAVLVRPAHAAPRALVVVVNRRPKGSLAPDLARISLRVTATRAVGPPAVLRVIDPLAHPPAPAPALCNLRGPSAGLSASSLRAVLAAGPALTGFSSRDVVAQAWDIVCGRPADPAFRTAVTGPPAAPCPSVQGAAPCCAQGAPSCCPPNAQCVPPPPCGCCGAQPCAVTATRGARPPEIVCPQPAMPAVCPA